MTLGESIRERRKALPSKLSQKEFGEIIGVSLDTEKRWEHDQQQPRADELLKIAAALGCSVSELLGEGEGEGGKNNADSVTVLRFADVIQLPVISPEMTACCGAGINALDITSTAEEYATFAKEHIGAIDSHNPPYAIHTEGDSMKDWNIPNGCIVAVNPAEIVANMDICLVSYFGKLSLKRVRFMPDRSVDLLSSDGKRIHIDAEDNIPELFQILGKAMATCCKISHGI